MKNRKRLYIFIGVAAFASYLLLLGSGFFDPPITDYASCAKANGRIQQTFPEVCVKNGHRFVNQADLTNSGTVEGTVRLFPSQPTCQTGQSCTSPAKGIKVDLTDDSGNIIAQATSDDSGFYSLTAPTGQYTVQIDANSPGKGSSQKVTIAQGQTLRVDMSYDSGIR